MPDMEEEVADVPFVKVVMRVQTQHMPVVQAKSFKLPHLQTVRRKTSQTT